MPSQLDNIKNSLVEANASEDFKEEIISYSKNLEEKGLPVIFSLPDLSFKIGLPFHVIQEILKDKSKHYKTFKIQKKTGGHRWITSPDEQLKRIQRWIYENILKNVPEHDCSFGFVNERSIVDNAKKHVKQDTILNVDLYRFFDSIEQKRVAGVFKHLGYQPNLAYSIAELLTAKMSKTYWKEIEEENIFKDSFIKESPQILPQGSPASPRIANFIAHSLDTKMELLANKLNLNYSRYADDLTFSGNYKKLPSIKTLRKIVKEEGFNLNEKKVKYFKRSHRQIVTGVVVNDKISVPREFKEKLRTELYHCIKKGPLSHQKWLMKNKDFIIKANYRDHLLGKVCFVHSVEPEKGREYLEMYNQIKWEL